MSYSQSGAWIEGQIKRMALRRMFSKSITNSSQFLMMPQSSQNLYFHLGMNADDDGFCEHFALMRMTDSKPDDLKILQVKGFVSVFDDKVLVISDWKENNYLRSDRYTPSKYLEIYKEELHRLSSGIPTVDNVATQVRLGKDRKGKIRLGQAINNEPKVSLDPKVSELIKLFEAVNPAASKWYGNPTQRKACDRLLKKHSLDQLTRVVHLLPKTNEARFAPTITTPLQLEDKLAQLVAYIKKEQSNEVIL